MSVLSWWAIPVGATLIAILVMYVVNRPRRRSHECQRSIHEFQQFRTALGDHDAVTTSQQGTPTQPRG